MKSPNFVHVSVVVLVALLASAANAQAPGRVATMTRTAKLFSDLEGRINDAASRHDQAALEKFLAPQFEQRDASSPGQPLPRADFIGKLMAQPGGALHDMAVHEFGTTFVVSYAAKQFVVDVWVRNGDDYQLAARYTGGTPPAKEGVDPKL
jgi:hypothetical protein